MRVTQNMIDRNMLFAISRLNERLSDINRQLSSGQRVNTVSDDVPDARQVMYLERENGRIDMHLRNLDSLDAVYSVATSTLGHVSESVSRLKELTVQAATGTYTQENLRAMAAGVDGLLQTLVSLGNVEHAEAYIFSGEAVQTAPFQVSLNAEGEIDSVSYEGEMIETEVPVAPEITARINFAGKKIFQGESDLFDVAIRLREAMRDGDVPEIQQLIEELEVCHSTVRESLGRVGERQAQLQTLRSTSERFRDLNTQIISERQDADVADLSVRYNSNIALLEMTMRAAARAVKPSILNFL